MGKAKTKKRGETTQLHGIKNGFVKKNKDSKFKNTPTGCKIALINNSKGQDRDSSFNKGSVNTKNNYQKPKPFFNNSKQASKSPQQSKQNSPKEKQNSPNNRQKYKFLKKTSSSSMSDSDEFDSDKYDFDIDEGVTSQVDASLNETETSEEDSDSDVPDILGKSLGDESDEDDEDFEEEEDDSDEEEVVERKGVKMFNGLQSEAEKNIDSKKDLEEEDDDDTSESDENMVSGKIQHTSLTSSSLSSLFESDEDEDEDNHRKQVQNITNSDRGISKETRDWLYETDSNDSSDSSDSSNSSDDSTDTEFGTKKLFEECTAKDSDDEENHNSVTKDTVTKKITGEAYKNDEAIENKNRIEYKDKRTILINNVPRTTSIRNLALQFSQYGVIRKIQLRTLPDMIIVSRKVAAQLGIPLDYPNLKTYVAFIEFEREGSAEAAAAAMNGLRTTEGNFLNVLTARQIREFKHEPKKTVFFSNFKPGLDPEEDLWKLFITCGDRIKRLKVFRDYKTGLTNGTGYVCMESEVAARTIVEAYNNVAKIGGQPIHLRLMSQSYDSGSSNKNDDKVMKQGTKRTSPYGDKKSSKKLKTGSKKMPVASNVEQNTINKKKKQQRNNKGATSAAFQGQKVGLKNKKKKNRLDKKKKKMAGKLTAKSAKA